MIPAVTASPTNLRVRFSVYAPEVKPSQSVYVCGSCAELGEWDVMKAVRLSDAAYPLWTADVDVKSAHVPFAYKFFLAETSSVDAEMVMWQIEPNRLCEAPETCTPGVPCVSSSTKTASVSPPPPKDAASSKHSETIHSVESASATSAVPTAARPVSEGSTVTIGLSDVASQVS